MNGLRNFSEFEPAQDPSPNCAETRRYTWNAGGTSFKDGMQGTQQLQAIHEIAPGIFLHPDRRQPIRFVHELQDLPIERETDERSEAIQGPKVGVCCPWLLRFARNCVSLIIR